MCDDGLSEEGGRVGGREGDQCTLDISAMLVVCVGRINSVSRKRPGGETAVDSTTTYVDPTP